VSAIACRSSRRQVAMWLGVDKKANLAPGTSLFARCNGRSGQSPRTLDMIRRLVPGLWFCPTACQYFSVRQRAAVILQRDQRRHGVVVGSTAVTQSSVTGLNVCPTVLLLTGDRRALIVRWAVVEEAVDIRACEGSPSSFSRMSQWDTGDLRQLGY